MTAATAAGRTGPAARGRALLALVGSVGLAGATAVLVAGASVLDASTPPSRYLLLVLLTTLLTDVTAIDLRVGRHAESFTWSELSIVLGLALLPADQLVLTSLALGVAYLATGQPLVKWVLNVGSYAVGLALAVVVSRAVATPSWERPGATALALLAGVACWTVWNKLTVVAAISLAQGRDFFAVLRSEVVSSLVVVTCNVGLAFGCLVLASGHRALLWAAPGCIVLAGVLNRCYLRLVQDRAAWRELERASRELTALDEPVLVAAALRRVTALMQADSAELLLTTGDQHRVHRLRDGKQEPVSEQASEPVGPVVTVARTDGSVGLPVECTEACVPLDGPGGPLGRLVVQYDGAVRLSRRERSQLTAYAGSLSVALCNARLHAQLREQAERSAHAARHDPLTGLPNRAQLRDRLTEAASRGQAVSVLLLDLDRFKPVNDTHGHEAGDEVLRVVASRLQGALRPTDLVARLGGDEFAVLLTAHTDSAVLIDRLRAIVAAPISLAAAGSSAVVSVGVSVGSAAQAAGAGDPEALLRAADDEMYRDKRRTPDARGRELVLDRRAGDDAAPARRLVALRSAAT